MIVLPKTPDQWKAMTAFMQHYAGVYPGNDLQVIGWVSEHKLVMVVGFNGFIGKLAQIHAAYAPGWHFTPRAMLREVFHHAFNTAQLEMLLGVVNSKNVRAMKFDLRLGFRELHRLPGMHDDGGDLVLLGMKKAECRYLRERVVVKEKIAAQGGA